MKLRLTRIAKFLLVVVLTASILFTYKLLEYFNFSAADKGTRNAINAVVVAYWTADFKGAYWENELISQWGKISGYTDEQKLHFLTAVVKKCELDTASALAFAEIAKPHAESLVSALRQQMKAETDQVIKGRLGRQALILEIENGLQASSSNLVQ